MSQITIEPAVIFYGDWEQIPRTIRKNIPEGYSDSYISMSEGNWVFPIGKGRYVSALPLDIFHILTYGVSNYPNFVMPDLIIGILGDNTSHNTIVSGLLKCHKLTRPIKVDLWVDPESNEQKLKIFSELDK